MLKGQGCDYYNGDPGVIADYEVSKNAFQDYIADYYGITDHSKSNGHMLLKNYIKAGD